MSKFVVCDCGNPENNHNYRHPFNGVVTVERHTGNVESKGEFFVIDALDFKTQTVLAGDKCQVPQCNSKKLLHGTVIQHPYLPSETYEKRIIKFTLPLDTVCRACISTLEKHNSLTHIFKTHIVVKNKEERDEVMIKGRSDDQKIDFNL